jgi:hypothetical protein
MQMELWGSVLELFACLLLWSTTVWGLVLVQRVWVSRVRMDHKDRPPLLHLLGYRSVLVCLRVVVRTVPRWSLVSDSLPVPVLSN